MRCCSPVPAVLSVQICILRLWKCSSWLVLVPRLLLFRHLDLKGEFCYILCICAVV
jgi:hypothetical protein